MENRLRVCHLIHSLGPGGAEHVLVDLAEVAALADIDLSVVSLMPFPATDGHVGDLRDRGASVSSVDLSSRWDPRAFGRARHVIESQRPGVLHTHLKHADLVGAVAVRRLRIPMVSTLHLIEDTATPVGRAKRWLGAQARLRAADVTIAVSDALRRWYLESFAAEPARVVTLRNGVSAHPVSPESRSSVRSELGIGASTTVVTNLAMMRPGKGHEHLIEAVRLLDPELDVVVVLAGDGPERARLEALARGVDPGGRRIVFAGFRSDVSALLSASDIVVHPSLFDALPTALIHALAAGLPSVASDVGGVPEIITPETGVLVAPGRPDEIARALRELVCAPRIRTDMGVAARARFDAEFSAPIWVRRLRDIYDGVVAA
jgi:glycosyltransferase involved in cell wall biosynthesis